MGGRATSLSCAVGDVAGAVGDGAVSVCSDWLGGKPLESVSEFRISDLDFELEP